MEDQNLTPSEQMSSTPSSKLEHRVFAELETQALLSFYSTCWTWKKLAIIPLPGVPLPSWSLCLLPQSFLILGTISPPLVNVTRSKGLPSPGCMHHLTSQSWHHNITRHILCLLLCLLSPPPPSTSKKNRSIMKTGIRLV